MASTIMQWHSRSVWSCPNQSTYQNKATNWTSYAFRKLILVRSTSLPIPTTPSFKDHPSHLGKGGGLPKCMRQCMQPGTHAGGLRVLELSMKISIITSGVVICYLVTLRVLHFNCNKQIMLRLWKTLAECRFPETLRFMSHNCTERNRFIHAMT